MRVGACGFRGALFALLALSCAVSCKRTPDHEPPGATPEPSLSVTPFAVATPSATVSAAAAPAAPVEIEVAIGGDAIPQVKVLANDIADVFEGIPKCWASADARVFNLEAPIGERKGLPGDKTILAFAAPPEWFGKLYAASKANALVVANNHSCDLGPEGLAATVAEAKRVGAPIAGASADDPWKRVDVVEKSGRRVCMVAWTTFLNDKGRKQKGCLEGSAGAKVARAELGPKGLEQIESVMSSEGRWEGCDARIVYIHGGREYRAQIRPVMEQALAASPYVDAVVITHPHVPDEVTSLTSPAAKNASATGGRATGRSVPVYKSLGNFVSNQGIAWTPGMSVELLEVDGVPDPIRTVWTRVSVIARLHFGWTASAPPGSAPSSLKYGYSLAFSDRAPPVSIKLRPLPNGPDDPVAKKLAKGPAPFSKLLDGKCRVEPDAPPACDGLEGESTSTLPTDAPSAPEPVAHLE